MYSFLSKQNMGAEMRVLFIHEVNYLAKPIFEMHEVPEALAAMSHEVYFMHFPEGWNWRRTLAFPRRKEIAGRVEAGVNVQLITPATLGGGIFGRLVFAASAFFQLRTIIRSIKPDLVYCYSVPTSGWQALAVCKREKIPFLFRALDVSSRIRRTHFRRLVEIAESHVLRNSDWVSANNPTMADYARSHGSEPGKVSIEYPPLDTGHFAECKLGRAELRSRLGLKPTDNVILFMGSFFYFSGLPRVIETFSRLRKDGDYLVLIGMGEQEAELRAKVSETGTEKFVLFTGRIEYESLPDYLSIGDVAINPFVSSRVANTALPNKVLQYMASGLTVVSTRLEGLMSTFGLSGNGLFFAHTPGEVVEKSFELLRSPADLSSYGVENRKLVQELFNKADAIDAMFERMTGLAEGDE